MSHLTAKQEAFALAYFGGMNASDAYRSAYDAGDMKPETINRKAKEVIDNGKVAARIKELKDAIEPILQAKFILNKETAIERLLHIGDKAMEAGQFGASATSTMGACKIAGLVVDKLDARLEITESQAKVTAANLYQKRLLSD